MRARASIRAEAGADGRTRLAVLRSQAPLVLRPAADAVYLAAGAGGPVGGDEVELAVEVGPGAELTLRTVAATVALPGAGESCLRLRFAVAAGGRLAVLPEPTVVAAGARHRVWIDADVAAGGRLLLRDEVVLGRHGEAGGRYRGLLRVDLDGAPLLRHELVLDGADPVTADLASAVAARATGSLLVAGPDWTVAPPGAAPSTGGADWAVLPLAGPGVLVTATADDAHTLRTRLDAAAAVGL